MAYRISRLLHLSDIHFGRDHTFTSKSGIPASATGTLLDILVADYQKREERPDVVVISGDMSSTAQRTEFDEASSFLAELLKRFEIDTNRLLVVPGNHDVLWGRGDCDASHAEYEAFASRLYKKPVGDLVCPSIRIGDVYLLGLDSTRVEQPDHGGIGFIGKDQLHKAHRKVIEEGQDARVRILVVHHHLLPVAWSEKLPSDYPTSITLDAAALLAWAQDNGFTAILHGHQHQPYLTTFHYADRKGGPFIVSGAPSASGRELPPQGRNGYQSLLVDGDRLVVSVKALTEANEYESKDHEFVQEITGVFSTNALPTSQKSREPTLSEVRTFCRIAVNKVAGLLKQNYGPRGGLRGVLDPGGPAQIRDGQNILSSVTGEGPVQGRVVQTLLALAQQVTADLGDGRKTAALICSTAVEAALEEIENGASDEDVAHGILEASKIAVEYVMENATPVTSTRELTRVAQTAANGDSAIANSVVDAIETAGSDGLVVVDEAPSDDREGPPDTFIKKNVEDHPRYPLRKLPDGLDNLDPDVLELRNALVLVYTGNIGHARVELIPLMEMALRIGRPLLCFCEGLSDESRAIIVKNFVDGKMKCIPITAAEMIRPNPVLTDIAILTHSRYIDATAGESLVSLKIEDFGGADRIYFDNEDLVIVNGHGKAKNVRHHRAQLDDQIEREQSPYRREKLVERKARLGGKVVNLFVSGISQPDAKIRKCLLEDSLHAAREAVRTGFVPGISATLMRCADHFRTRCSCGPEEMAGRNAFARALEEPLRCIIEQAGLPTDETIEALRDNPGLTIDLFDRRILQLSEGGPLDAAGAAARLVRLAGDAAARLVRTRSWELTEGMETAD